MNIKNIFIFLFLNHIFHLNSLKIEKKIKNPKKKDNKKKDIEYSYLQDIRNDNENLIDISDEYDLINPKNPDYFYIPILGSSDIHGHFYPEELEIGNISYSKGGLDYLAKYINILRNEFQNNFLYLDAGDLFQGGTESSLTNGEIIMDYLNLINVDAVAFGNHEFDEDRETLEQKVGKSKFPFLTANMFDIKKNTKKAFGKNHLSSKIFTFEVPGKNTKKAEVKIGVIGLTMKRLKNQMSGNGYEHIIFSDYKDELISEANKLKIENKVNAVILLVHILLECEDENNNLVLKMFKPTDKQSPCDDTNDLYKLIDSLDEGIIDAVVAGHSHKQVHHWIKNIPIISPINNGLYTNVLYLAFDRKNNYKIIPSEARIEGPIPICEKVFKKTHNCEFIKPSELEEFLPLVEYKFHNSKIEKDPALKPIHDKYDNLYKAYREKISTIIGTEDTLKIDKNGNCYIGNIMADIQSSVTGAEISIVSYGNLRGELNPGKVPYYKIKDLLPYKTRICSFRMKGYEVKKMMKIIQSGRKKYYLVSGLKQILAKNKKGEYYLSNVKLFNGIKEFEIISEREYLISANDYLIKKGGNDFNKILSWYKPRSLNCNYGPDLEIANRYLRDQKVIDVRKFKDNNNPRIRFIG